LKVSVSAGLLTKLKVSYARWSYRVRLTI